ncbi:MAG: glycoside hydrolase family 2 protein, partial [Bryobacteraceae bacterium]
HSVWVVNSFYREFRGLQVTARLFDFSLRPRGSWAATVDVAPDGNTRAFVLRWPPGLTRTFFLSLKLADRSGRVLSDNFYWLSTLPEIPASQGSRGGVFYLDTKSYPDYTALTGLPPAPLRVFSEFRPDGPEMEGVVTVENPGDHLAFLVQLSLRRGENGEEIAPCYWEDNYFSLLPGKRREIRVRFPTAELPATRPVARASSWPEFGRRGAR